MDRATPKLLDKGQSSAVLEFVLDFRYVASFRNHSASKATGVRYRR